MHVCLMIVVTNGTSARFYHTMIVYTYSFSIDLPLGSSIRRIQRGIVPIHLTEPSSSNAPLSNLEQQKAQNLLDILFTLGRSPLYIHKLQLQLSLESRYYIDIQKNCSKYNKAKQHEEKVGKSIVKYLVYPNGKVMVFVACSNNPIKLEDEADESILYSFLGQVRDRLLYLVTDPHERIVPPIIKWVLTGCDINKDITVTDMRC
ncbi:MAG: hypothetical protein WCC17_15030 [Candidatus Nitrosopolaris sp.]